MLSKNKIKFINSIKKKKYRDVHQCFFVEGEKLIDELINSNVELIEVLATPDWIKSQKELVKQIEVEISEVTDNELSRISSLSTPNKVFAIAKQPVYTFDIQDISNKLSLFLDNINDPGNLGTIIRIADWFGIEHIFCSNESVELFNPKVVQSTMGAIYRVKVHYVDPVDFLKSLSSINQLCVYGTFLEGENIYCEELSETGMVIMGSESHGISKNLYPFINKKLHIPTYSKNLQSSESLNISTATAIICSEFRRRQM